MSLDAIRWALFEAPLHSRGVELKGYNREVLLCLAEHAGKDGSNSWPSRERIGLELWGTAADQKSPVSEEAWRNKADTRVKRAFRDLERGGWIQECSDRSGRAFGRRSKVWSLNLDLRRGSSDSSAPDGESRGYMGVPREGYAAVPLENGGGGTPVTDKGYMGVLAGGTPVTDKGYMDVPQTVSNPLEPGGERADAPAQVAHYDSVDALAKAHSQASLPGQPDWVQGTPEDPRCPTHAGLSREAVPPCRRCGEARAWYETNGKSATEDARAARRAAIDECGICDQNGMREVTGGLMRCDHTPPALDLPPWERAV